MILTHRIRNAYVENDSVSWKSNQDEEWMDGWFFHVNQDVTEVGDSLKKIYFYLNFKIQALPIKAF